MPLNLSELKQWSPEITDLAETVKRAASNHTNSAEFYRSLSAVSGWEGQSAEAAKSAREATARDHDAAAENLDKSAASMEHVGEEAEVVGTEIKGILDDAAAQPSVHIDETTNAVDPPDTSYMTDEYAARVAAKVTDLQKRIAKALADGERLDADLAGAINTAAGLQPPVTKPASSIEDLMLPADAQRGRTASAPQDLNGALDQLAGRPVPKSGGAGAGPQGPVPLDPAKVEQFKAMTRQMLQRQGVPPDQIEQRLNAAVAAAQRPLSPYTPPKADAMPPPGFGEGFADRWFSTEEGFKDLLGQNGLDALKDSWGGLAKGTGEQLVNPLGSAIGEAKDALHSPSAAYYLGEKSADTAVTAPGLMFGGEGALARAGLDDLGGTGAIPHELIDHPGPVVEHPAPLGVAEHPIGGNGYDSGAPALPEPNPGPEFTLNNPTHHMSPELLRLSEAHLTDSGTTVLGPYRPADGGPSYIEVAHQNGASYFDIGDAWDAATPTERLAANQHVLDMAITNNDTITMSVPFRKIEADTFTAAEIRYLEARGYRRMGENMLIPPQ